MGIDPFGSERWMKVVERSSSCQMDSNRKRVEWEGVCVCSSESFHFLMPAREGKDEIRFICLNPFLPDVYGGKTMLEQLSSINWSDLSHAYGEAGDVPQLLRDLA